ncbi:MAG: hypothetical protein ILA04_09190 [Prevotella sp.]|nr:hypothetical protein [Prevotella sp.]
MNMKKMKKGLLSLAILTSLCGTMQMILHSCQNDTEDVSVNNSRALLEDLVISGQALATKSIVCSNTGPTRPHKGPRDFSNDSHDPRHEKETSTIAVDFPPNTDESLINLLGETKTLEDLIELRRLARAIYTYDVDASAAQYSVEVSKAKVTATMSPMVEKSKKFLKEEKGFTEEEIQEMLAENNVDETQLVPLVALICEQESRTGNGLAANSSFGFNLLATPCYANSRIVDCAMKAIGADVLYSLASSGLKTWSKALIRQSFKVIAKRALGPIGAAIAVAEFALCI